MTEEDARAWSRQNPGSCVTVAQVEDRLVFRKKRIPSLVYAAAVAVSISTTAGIAYLVVTHTDVAASFERLVDGRDEPKFVSGANPGVNDDVIF